MNMMTTAQTSKTTEDMVARACYAHRGMIANIARKYQLSEDAAEELIQEVVIYITLYHRQYGLDLSVPSKFNSMVRGSAIQRALNMKRRWRVRVNDEYEMLEGFEARCSGELPDQIIEAEYRLERAFAVVGECRHDQLSLLLSDYNSWQIANIRGISLNTSYSRTSAIRQEIEKELQDD